jgi:hypothetical protein
MSQKPTNFIKSPKRFWKTEYEKVLSWLEEKYRNADPDARRKFEDKFDDSIPTEQSQEYFIDENSREFGLTKGDYEFLLSDIAQGIEDANRKYGYGEAGIIGKDGDFYPFPDANKPRKIKKPSTEDVAIANGIIKVHHPNSKSEKVGDC